MTKFYELVIIKHMGKEKLKTVNGVKIIKRYSIGTIITLFLTIILIALPLVQLLLDAFTLKVDSSILPHIPSTQDSILFKGLDVFEGGIGLFRIHILKHLDVALNDFGLYFEEIINNVGFSFADIIIPILIMLYVAFLIVELTIAFVDVFALLDMLLLGRLHFYKVPNNSASALFIMQLLISADIAGLYIFSCLGGNFQFEISLLILPIVYISLSFLTFIITLIVYLVSFKDGVFVRRVNEFVNEEKKNEKPVEVKKPENVVVYGNQTKNYYTNVSSFPPQQPSYPNQQLENSYKPNKGLPANLKEIADQAFNADINLEVAIIPFGIKYIGNSSFANCINLKVVSIPSSVKNIGYNAFFNCYSLKRINFGGTKEEWREIKRGSNWLTKAGTTSVVCRDGALIVNPNR